ncbi:hypothetical protein [Cellulomonas endophytica]|uniref:hypothetical protein n=1 Tax=Cellulomonas endophytica TaxID=2494735 RepID=UPI00101393EB|nr:hypothetical protein [Cellulomonas endophytica]
MTGAGAQDGSEDAGHRRFSGHIAGAGSTSGVRLVVGRWLRSPLGAFADVMLEDVDGRRHLLVPRPDVAELVAGVYRFDEVVDTPVRVRTDRDRRRWHVEAGPLQVDLTVGWRTALGALLRTVPGPLATSTAFATAVDPVARRVLPGVRTRGRSGGRTEWYGATDQHAVVALAGSWQGSPLGALAPVEPAVRFGFSSTPRRPTVTRVTTTIGPLRPPG